MDIFIFYKNEEEKCSHHTDCTITEYFINQRVTHLTKPNGINMIIFSHNQQFGLHDETELPL